MLTKLFRNKTANPLVAMGDQVVQRGDDLSFALSHVNWDRLALIYGAVLLGLDFTCCMFLVSPAGFKAEDVFFIGSTGSMRAGWKACVPLLCPALVSLVTVTSCAHWQDCVFGVFSAVRGHVGRVRVHAGPESS
jgi:hypothetical protein